MLKTKLSCSLSSLFSSAKICASNLPNHLRVNSSLILPFPASGNLVPISFCIKTFLSVLFSLSIPTVSGFRFQVLTPVSYNSILHSFSFPISSTPKSMNTAARLNFLTYLLIIEFLQMSPLSLISYPKSPGPSLKVLYDHVLNSHLTRFLFLY